MAGPVSERPPQNETRVARWLRGQRHRIPNGLNGRPALGAAIALIMVSVAAVVGPLRRAAPTRAVAEQTPSATSQRPGSEADIAGAAASDGSLAAATADAFIGVDLGDGPPPARPVVGPPPSLPPVERPEPPPITEAMLAVGVAPVPAKERVPKPRAVRGVYLNAWAAGSPRKRAKLIALADRTEIDAFVIDVKDASGHISYESTIPLAQQVGAPQRRFADVRELLAEMKAHGIYPIARIVAFKDPVLAGARHDLALRTRYGDVWRDRYGDVWVDAFNRHVWDYEIAIAREALSLGFAEVQWDYVRFPDTPAHLMRDVVYPAREGRTKADAIREFLSYSREQLSDLAAPVTADVFGLTTSAGSDMGIGQFWPKMVDATDVLLPMVYPSHYVRGSYGIADPNASPYEVVKTALQHAIRRSRDVAGAAAIRPWLQDFTLGEPRYGATEVRAQIQAVYDVGLDEWVLWNAGSDYTAEALTARR